VPGDVDDAGDNSVPASPRAAAKFAANVAAIERLLQIQMEQDRRREEEQAEIAELRKLQLVAARRRHDVEPKTACRVGPGRPRSDYVAERKRILLQLKQDPSPDMQRAWERGDSYYTVLGIGLAIKVGEELGWQKVDGLLGHYRDVWYGEVIQGIISEGGDPFRDFPANLREPLGDRVRKTLPKRP
jgi:hypothetical protein